MDFLLHWDHDLFLLINKSFQNTFFDTVMPVLRNRYFWIPFYVGVITYIFTRYSSSKASYYILFIVSAVVFTDLTSGQVLKKFVRRERPCHEPTLDRIAEIRIHCSRSYSFPSSHAANHFGLAVILMALFGKNRKKFALLFYGWAALISFAQIYVGVHFPLDIIGGALLGVIIVRLYLIMIAPILNKLAIET